MDRAVDEVGDRFHVRFLQAARGQRRRAQADAAGDLRRARVVGNAVLVGDDAGLFQRFFDFGAGERRCAARRSTSIRWLSVPPLTRR